ncbi:RrF2 family transcriptional regulator [Parasphaerochaeta coccoides]|uniref:Transcriptional regulator, BadM/Rrf2 family n=1 Tax=Parasphaerochaeta coccoides (strain ATCC BAA-1237 / DSM 17374 / SPN1) TaxID=760011 RepID=F4GK30_PARC1|nr:Rrf2 family transcriptional regulator [Parasphaerochaeta coccoides]AEC01802.1 transcriptional regulator, BadM/Rrf2 family [Parasphaerochaeta coccoides DSM 17374]
MKISTRTHYGVRLLVDLASQDMADPVPLATTAGRQDIPLRYLEQVADILRWSGFLLSVKGASGGYRLARPAQDILLGDVLRALEGDLNIVDPLQSHEAENRLQQCLRLTVYNKLEHAIANVVDTISLASLIGSSDENEGHMYFI